MLWCGAHYNRSSSAKNKSYQSDKHYEKNKCIPCRTLHSVHGDVRYDITNFNLVVLRNKQSNFECYLVRKFNKFVIWIYIFCVRPQL